MKSTLGPTFKTTNGDWPKRGDAGGWELLALVLDGKLSVQGLSQRQRMRPDEVHDWLRERQRSALVAFGEHVRQGLIRQGASAEALVGPELSVSLAEVSIIDWIQAVQLIAQQAVITILHGAAESRIWCAQGAVVDAMSGRLRGEAAVYRIAALEQGQVVTELRVVHRERTIRMSTPWLLLEAARRKDEVLQLRRQIGNIERYFHGSRGTSNRSLNTAEAALLRVFDAPKRLTDVLEQSELGDIESLAALASLIRTSHLVESDEIDQPPPPPSGHHAMPAGAVAELPIPFPWSRERRRRRSVWGWLVSTTSMGLVAAGAAWLGTRLAMASLEAAGAAELRTAAAQASYTVTVRAQPPNATIELDGRSVAHGSWTERLPRDGAVHELHVSAEGFVPLRTIFLDAPPPAHIRLEPLPTAPPAASGGVEPVAALVDDGTHAPPSMAELTPSAARKRAARARRSRALGDPSVPRSDGDPVGLTPAEAPVMPYVRIIDADEPLGPAKPAGERDEAP